MTQSNKDKILEYLKEHPITDNQSLSEMLDIPCNVVSRIMHGLEDKEIVILESERVFTPTHGSSCDRIGWKIK